MDALIGLYCVHATQLGHLRTLERIFQLLEERDYQVSDIRVIELEAPKTVKNVIEFDTDVDAAIQRALQAKTISFRTEHRGSGFSLGWSMDWSEVEKKPHLWVYDNKDWLFSGDIHFDIDTTHLLKSFLYLAKDTYEIVQPVFAFISAFAPEVAPDDTDVASLRLPELLWANFFSPAFVEKIGRTKLTAVPLGYTEELSDGGVLYLIDEDIFGDYTHDRYRARMKSYFRV